MSSGNMVPTIEWDLATLETHFQPSLGTESSNPGEAEICQRCIHFYWQFEMNIKAESDTLQAILDRHTSQKCFVCRILWNTFSRILPCPNTIYKYSPRLEEVEGEGIVVTEIRWLETDGTFGPDGEPESVTPHDFDLHVEIENLGVKYAPRIRPTFDDKMLYLELKNRLGNCDKHHIECQQGDDTLPYRLLDLSDPSCPVLVNGTHGITHGCYAALSYCWGGADFLRTIKDNIENHTQGIPQESLPILFQDVIRVTVKLGIRYLWIDSLCIIQDCAEDWATQSTKMRQIFANSYVVLAAGSVPSPLSGLTYEREEPIVVDHIYRSSQEPAVPVFARQRIKHQSWANTARGATGAHGGMVNPNHLDTRAWCYQESLLATRVLYLLEMELLLRCNGQYWCECQGEACPLEIDIPMIRCLQGKVDSDRSEKLEESEGIWNGIVKDYSALDISFPSDRFPAFEGIAASFQEPELGRYLAGFWEKDFPGCLFWQIAEEDQIMLRHRPPVYVAPTWSWASINSGVWTSSDSIAAGEGVLIEVECSHAGDSYFGQLAGGFIKLRTRLAPVGCIFSWGVGWFLRPSPMFVWPEQDIMPEDSQEWKAEPSEPAGNELANSLAISFDAIDDMEIKGKDLLMLAGFKVCAATEQKEAWRVLLLQPVRSATEDGVFRRVGIVRDQHLEWNPMWSEFFGSRANTTITII